MSYMYDLQVEDEDAGIIVSTYLMTIANLIVICTFSLMLQVYVQSFIWHFCVVMGMSRNDGHNILNTKVVFLGYSC